MLSMRSVLVYCVPGVAVRAVMLDERRDESIFENTFFLLMSFVLFVCLSAATL